jgi:hypothetical protein
MLNLLLPPAKQLSNLETFCGVHHAATLITSTGDLLARTLKLKVNNMSSHSPLSANKNPATQISRFIFGKEATVEEWYDRQHFYRKPTC